MATQSGSSLANDAGTGYVIADGFLGAPSAADNSRNRLSTQPALAPNGLTGAVTGSVTATNATVSGILAALGTMKVSGTSVAAAGTTITDAAALPSKIWVRASAAASTAGVKFTTVATNLIRIVKAKATVGVKVYATGAKIDAAATGTALVIASNKAVLFWCASPTQVYTFKGA